MMHVALPVVYAREYSLLLPWPVHSTKLPQLTGPGQILTRTVLEL